MSRWVRVLQQVSRRLWWRATLIGLLGVFAAIFAALVEWVVPWELPDIIEPDAIDSLLAIIASSMLAVTTFSLSVMTAAYGSASNSVTPRATRLLVEDSLTQTVLSTFIGSFLFSIVGIIVLKTGSYGVQGRAVLFIVTILVIVLIVASLLRWIDYLTRFGRQGETTQRVEAAACQALTQRLHHPYMGCSPWLDEAPVPESAVAVSVEAVGYVQYVAVAELNALAQKHGLHIYVAAVPGTFVYSDTHLLWLHQAPTEAPNTSSSLLTPALVKTGVSEQEQEAFDQLVQAVRNAFVIASERSFEQDPRFGLAVMSEVGSRALSPATNDPGTAIDVIGRMTRLLTYWAVQERQPSQLDFPHVFIPPLQVDDLFDDAFMLLARDGAGLIEVQLRLQKAFAALARIGDENFRRAARQQAELAWRRAKNAMLLEEDKARVQKELEWVYAQHHEQAPCLE